MCMSKVVKSVQFSDKFHEGMCVIFAYILLFFTGWTFFVRAVYKIYFSVGSSNTY